MSAGSTIPDQSNIVVRLKPNLLEIVSKKHVETKASTDMILIVKTVAGITPT